MKVVIQRALASSVEVDNKLINKIEKGMVILVGVNVEDTSEDVDYLVRKTLNLRIFDDENGVMNKSILDVGGENKTKKQIKQKASKKDRNKPSNINTMKKEEAVKLYEKKKKKLNEKVKTYPGVFGAEMKVSITNDGPITIIIDSKNK